MKLKNSISLAFLIVAGLVFNTGCQKGNLIDNPNVALTGNFVPISLVFNHLTSTLVRSDELPWATASNNSQYWLSNYSYYRGVNFYNWSYTPTDSYDILRYAKELEKQAALQYATPVTSNSYYALGKFFEAYAGIWISQRVGDAPYIQGGITSNLTPKYDVQHDIYKLALAQLDTANSVMTAALKGTTASVNSTTGDIYGLGTLGWQKIINSFKLRVLISLSKRATDNADLNIPTQFANIINNPATYPILGSNADNLTYVFNSINPYPIKARGNQPYNKFANMNKTFISILSANQDPRIFLFATPVPSLIAGGKTIGDFTAYVGADVNTSQAVILNNSDPVTGQYSFANGARYYSTTDGATADPFVIIGYPEQCFNIAEGIELGWVSGNASTYYNNGLTAGFSLLKLTEGLSVSVSDLVGTSLGKVTISIANFLTNPNVVLSATPATALQQIWSQKYVALFNNSGYEGFYLWRRTGFPVFSQGGDGIGTSNKAIPRRWQMPSLEQSYNSANYKASLAQFGGTDDITKDTWLTK